MSKKQRFSLKMPAKSDWVIQICILVLACFGTLMITSASMGTVSGSNTALFRVIIKQLVFIAIGYFSLVFMARWFNFERCERWIPIVSVIMEGALLMCLLFEATNGAFAWIKVPVPGFEITIQPSEFAKIVVILLMARYLGDIDPSVDIFAGMKRVMILIGIYAFTIMLLQKDFGSMAVLVAIAMVIFLLPRHPLLTRYQKLDFYLILAGISGLILIMTPAGSFLLEHIPFMRYQISRFTSAMNPFADRYGGGYQLIAGLVAFAKGGISGVGFGNSFQKYTNFPEASSDFILSIVVEETGMFGFILIFICYFLIIFQLFRYAFKIKSQRGRMILVGVAMYIFIHYTLNVGGVTCLIPLTGVPLLMISAGGSSMMSVMAAIGIAQSVISRYRRGLIK